MNKRTKKVQSLQGKRNGQVGAPPKPLKYPKTSFTIESLFERNDNQCRLSIRTKVKNAIEAGEIVQLLSKKQADGAVGRPESVYVLKENFNADKMTKFGHTPKEKTRKANTSGTRKNRTVAVAQATPAGEPAPAPQAPVAEPVAVAASPAPAPEAPAAPASEPVVS